MCKTMELIVFAHIHIILFFTFASLVLVSSAPASGLLPSLKSPLMLCFHDIFICIYV